MLLVIAKLVGSLGIAPALLTLSHFALRLSGRWVLWKPAIIGSAIAAVGYTLVVLTPFVLSLFMDPRSLGRKNGGGSGEAFDGYDTLMYLLFCWLLVAPFNYLGLLVLSNDPPSDLPEAKQSKIRKIGSSVAILCFLFTFLLIGAGFQRR